MGKWQALIFDLDDTLYPEREYVLSGFRAVASWAAERLGVSENQGFSELNAYFKEGIRGDTFNRWLERHNLSSPENLARLISVYRSHQPSLSPFPVVPHLLASLKERYRLGIVSDGYLEVQRAKFAGLGLAPYFHSVVFSDEFGRNHWKPSTRPFEAIVERLNVTPEQAVYIADNPIKDFIGARHAGLATIWVRHSAGEYCHLIPPTPEHAADLTLDCLGDLQQLFGLSQRES